MIHRFCRGPSAARRGPHPVPCAIRLAAAALWLLPAVLLQAQFTSTVIGTGGVTGSITTNPPPPTGSYRVVGGGEDIGGTADNFTFHALDVSGNFDIRARIDSLEANDNDTKAGLMARQESTAGSRMAYIRATPSGRTLSGQTGLNDVKLMLRRGTAAPDNSAVELPAVQAPAPAYPNAWLRLVRSGNTLLAFRGANGTDWTLLGAQDSAAWPGGALPPRLRAGLAVSRGPQGQNRTATAEYRSFANAGPFPPFIAPIPDQSTDEDSSGVTVGFAIGDLDDTTALTVTAASSDSALVDAGTITLGGTGTNRTALVKPVPNASGDVRITVTVRDAARSASTSFLLTVRPVNDRPTISNLADRTINEDQSTGAIPFQVGDPETPAGQLLVQATSSNTTLVPNANITLSGQGGDRTVSIQPAPQLSGNTTITVTVTDGAGASTSDTFVLTVNPQNDPPTITEIADQTINEDGTAGPLAFTLGDIDTALAALTVSAASTDTVLVPPNAITLGGSGASRTITVKPASNRSGSAQITITVRDGVGSTSEAFTLTVLPVDDPPTISDVPDQATDFNRSLGPVGFTVADPDTPVGQLQVTRTSDNTTLVPLEAIVLGGTAGNRTVTVTPGKDQAGQTRLTLTVSDGVTRVSDSFLLTVRPPPAPQISAQPVSTEADEGSQVVLQVAAAGEALKYQWRRNGIEIAGATGATYTIPRLTADTAGSYTVVVSNPGGSATSTPAVVSVTRYDFGDAPEPPYPTKRTAGAAHRVWDPFHLGALIDSENDGQPNADATGDGTDEDGVAFLTSLTQAQKAQIRVRLVSPNSPQGVPIQGRLDAWIDFNGNGSWSDAGERIVTAAVLNAGDNTLEFDVPATAHAGTTFARFRLSQEGGMSPAGPSSQAGEVEDHRVSIFETPSVSDFGDAPEFTGQVSGPPPPLTYETTLARNGARHEANPQFRLGQRIDTELDGQPSPDALGDDITPSPDLDDEDGVTFLTPLRPGQSARVEVLATSTGRLDAWIDFDHANSWAAPTDRIVAGINLAPGANLLTFNVPTNALPGQTFARFRLSRQGKLGYTGPGGEGEVEDYRVEVTPQESNLDFGDAPERDLIPGAGQPPFSYETTLARNGARHLADPKFCLGQVIDVESDGQPDSLASLDDHTPVDSDDEDGVTWLTPLVAGQQAQVMVLASARGRLDAWIDFNHANSWADPPDRIFDARGLNAGLNVLTFAVPTNALSGGSFARFRFSRDGKLSHLGPGGLGEVEDYPVRIERDDPCDLACAGTDFWVTFPGNYGPDPANPVKPSLTAVGAAGTTVKVDIPGLGFSSSSAIPASGVLSVALPKAADLGDVVDLVENKGVHVTATARIGLYGLSKVTFTSDGFLALNTDSLGTDYVVQAYPNVHGNIPELNGTQFALVATENDTTVEITLPVVTTPHDKGVPYTVTLQAGETYQLRNPLGAPNDLSGAYLKSDKPIAVFGSHQCANVNSKDWFFCDYLVEQLVPVKRWATDYITHPLATRLNGDAIRILAAYDNTQVQLNGAALVTLQRGQIFETTRASASHFSANRPIHVTQYATSSDFDLATEADPFMVQVPGIKQFNANLAFPIPASGFASHFVNIVAPTAAAGTVQLDGVNVGAALAPVPGTPFSAGSAKITAPGVRHTVTAAQPVSVIVYGWGTYESYGYPACFFFGDTRPPNLTCPGAVTLTVPVPGTVPLCEAAVPDLRPQVKTTDNCGLPQPGTTGQTGVTQDPPPGTRLPPGEYDITVSAADANGNVGICVTRLIILDTSADQTLKVLCPPDLTVRCQDSLGAVVNYEALATKGCTRLPLECLPPPGSHFPIGTTTVVCLLEGQVVCTFNITVTCAQLLLEWKGANLVLNWDPGSTLQRADTLGGTWTDVPAASGNSIELTPGRRQEFFRVRP